MATVLPFTQTGPPPDGFVAALNGYTVSIVTLDFVRRSLAAALANDAGAAAALQSLIDQAYAEGQLAAADHDILSGDLGHRVDEDVPTEWSEEIIDEAGPADDTTRPEPARTEPPAVASRNSSLRPGAVLRDRFVLQSRVATGGMSEVYKALDRRRQDGGAENPWLAIKLLGPETHRYADALKLLEQEAALARQLDHPHIVRVFDFERDGDRAFITMEWLEGESLADLLTRQRYRPLTIAHARQILKEIGGALAYAHGRGITHADVKPGNIFLAPDGTAKLLDFGVARLRLDPAAAGAAAAHTPAYASCEILEGELPAPADDVFSMACVAYRMLAGRRTFGHHDALAAERAGRRLAPIRTLNESQWAALAHALAFRRAARTPDMTTFLREFNAAAPAAAAPVAATARVTVAPPAVIARATPAEPGLDAARPSLALIGAAAGIAALTVTLVFWSVQDPTPVADTATPMARPALPPPAQTAEPPAPTPAAVPDARAPAIPVATKKRNESTGRMLPAAPTDRPAAKPGRATTRSPAPATVARTPDAGAAGDTGAAVASPPASAPRSVDDLAPGDDMFSAAAPPPAGPSAGVPAPAGGLAETPAVEREASLPGTVSAAAAGPKSVPFADLKFKRYVEPSLRGRSRRPDSAGWVELSFVVGADGRARDIGVLNASPPGLYEEPAIAAVRRWRFEPAREGGIAVERRTSVRLRFQPE